MEPNLEVTYRGNTIHGREDCSKQLGLTNGELDTLGRHLDEIGRFCGGVLDLVRTCHSCARSSSMRLEMFSYMAAILTWKRELFSFI